MKYRVMLDLAFDSKIDAQKLIDLVKTIRNKASTINAGANSAERPKAAWHKCYHDEGLPCEPEQEI